MHLMISTLYFINSEIYRIINFILITNVFFHGRLALRLNRKLTILIGTLVLYCFFHGVFQSLGYYHFKNSLNMVGYLFIFNLICQNYSNKQEKFQNYCLFFASLICFLILFTNANSHNYLPQNLNYLYILFCLQLHLY